LNEKSYGIPLLRRWFLKTRFARKCKKSSRKTRPNFPHLEILAIAKTEKM
jgi:hypothetical protein